MSLIQFVLSFILLLVLALNASAGLVPLARPVPATSPMSVISPRPVTTSPWIHSTAYSKSHYCSIYLEWNSIDSGKDFVACHCLDKCLNEIDDLLFRSTLPGYLDVTFGLYECAQNCFAPNLSPLPLQRSLSVSFLLHVLEDTNENLKFGNLTEVNFYSSILDAGLQGPYVVLINELMADKKCVTPEDKHDVCFENIIRQHDIDDDSERQLEETFYCEKFADCLKDLVKILAMTQEDPMFPTGGYWNFYLCARTSFLAMNPLRGRH